MWIRPPTPQTTSSMISDRPSTSVAYSKVTPPADSQVMAWRMDQAPSPAVVADSASGR